MDKRKLNELISGIFILILVIGLIGYFLFKAEIFASGAPANFTSTLIDPPVDQLKEAQFGALIQQKNLKRYGNIPLVVSGQERTKDNNPFLLDEGQTEQPTYQTDQFKIIYPKSWSKNINSNSNLEFRPPLNNNIFPGFVRVSISEQKLSDKLETVLPDQANKILLGLPNLKIEKISQTESNGISAGKIPFSYKLGDQQKSGWIGGVSFASPSKSLSSQIYNIALQHKNESELIKSLSVNLKDNQESISQLLNDEIFIEELISFGENLKYNSKPYNLLVTFYYEALEANRSQVDSDADVFLSQIQFKEVVSGDSLISTPSDSGNSVEIPSFESEGTPSSGEEFEEVQTEILE